LFECLKGTVPSSTRRTTRLARFEWLYGTDGYVSGFGREVWVPLAMADRLLRGFTMEEFY